MVRSQSVVSVFASVETGFNSVRGVQGISVIQQSISANTVAVVLGISRCFVVWFRGN